MTRIESDEKRALERTLRQEIVEETSDMSAKQINQRIDRIITTILSGRVKGEQLLILKEKARLFAEVWGNRTGNPLE